MIALAVIVALIVLVALYAVAIYNKLVKLKNLVAEAWSGIDVQLKKRYDLIPNLVETVKGYAAHEKETFENVTKARAAAQQATTVEGHQAAEKNLNSALMNLNAVAERYQIAERGYLREGYFADLVLLDLAAPTAVTKPGLLYQCGWSPFEGHTFQSRIDTTLVNGQIVYHNGAIQPASMGQRLQFSR